MKILLIHNYYRFRGGEDRYVDILAQTLYQKKHKVIRFTYDSRDIEQYNLFQKIVIPFRLISSSKLNRELETLLENEKPDLAVVHNLSPLLTYSLLPVLKQNGVPILKRLENYKFLCLNGLFLRNDFTVCEECKNGNFRPGVFHRCYQRSFSNSLGIAISETLHQRRKTVIQNVDLFLATSEFVKSKFVQAGFPDDKIVVFPNFIDFEPIPEALEPENRDGGYAVYVGRLSKEKGLMTLLKAFKDLPDVSLKILGEGPMEKELKTFTRKHRIDNIEFAGFIDGDAKKTILSKALFTVFSSECYESFGYTIAESHACGVPVIASGIGCAKELVRENETGLLFEPGNPTDLKEKIRAMMSLQPQRLMEMKQKSLQSAKTSFTREVGYQNLQGLFKRLIG